MGRDRREISVCASLQFKTTNTHSFFKITIILYNASSRLVIIGPLLGSTQLYFTPSVFLISHINTVYSLLTRNNCK